MCGAVKDPHERFRHSDPGDLGVVIRYAWSMTTSILYSMGSEPTLLVRESVAGHSATNRELSLSVSRYSMTRSARTMIDGGIVRPSALAVLRLMTIWKCVGCSTGRSAGFAPRRI